MRLDANAFTLAVLNLIDNAIKYAADGKKIELRAARATTSASCCRCATGARASRPTSSARIFERFYRARAVRLKPIRGSGIGLALVQHIARAHGGDVAVDERARAGLRRSRSGCRLPRSSWNDAGMSDATEAEAPSARSGSSSSRTSPTSCAACATRSSSRASRSQARGTGAEGLAAAMDWAPDCVLLDLMLPDDNGYRVCETLRARDETVPIIILTAKAQESDKIRGLDAGADDYVTKPFSVAELIARINAIFRRQARMSSHADETFAIGAWTINARKHTMTQGPHDEAADVLRARGAEAAARARRRDGLARRAPREGLGHARRRRPSAPSTTSSSSCAASSKRTRRTRATSSRSTGSATSSSRRERGIRNSKFERAGS